MAEFIGLYISVALHAILYLVLGAYFSAGLLVFHVAVVPLIFRYSKSFRTNLIFANFVQWPLFVNYEDPAAVGIKGGRNFSIQYHSKIDNCLVKIGLWHIVPSSAYKRLQDKFESDDKEALNTILDKELANATTPIMLYCHGNSNSRAATHRIRLYEFFQRMEFHTIAFDYRGYGDSTNISPSEDGVVEDALAVYSWLHTVAEGRTIFVWGHSLGTGISSSLLGNLPSLSTTLQDRPPLPPPRGLILESPFNNLADEVAHHPLAKLVSWLPYFERTCVRPFGDGRTLSFRSDARLEAARGLPVLILHAEDDYIVPFIVGVKLYKSIKASRSSDDAVVTLHAFDKNLGLGHKWICDAPNLNEVVGEFVGKHS